MNEQTPLGTPGFSCYTTHALNGLTPQTSRHLRALDRLVKDPERLDDGFAANETVTGRRGVGT